MNVHDTGVVMSVETDVLIYSSQNFDVVYYDYHRYFVLFRKKLSHDFIKLTCEHAPLLIKYLNVTMSVETFEYIFMT